MELLVISTTPGLGEALQGYDGLQVSLFPSLARIMGLLASDQPPGAIYIEDTRGTLAELWEVITRAQATRVRVLVGLQGVGRAQRGDLERAGLPVTDLRVASPLAAWIAQQLGARPRASATSQVYAFSGTKGGIGKSQMAAACAGALRQRGARVLLVDGDLSNSGLKPSFKIGADAPSYLYLKSEGPRAFTPDRVRRAIYPHAPSGLHFLLGSNESESQSQDLVLGEWQALMQAVRALDEYDVVLVDTGPDLRKRPYAVDVALAGGWVILPTPPGLVERTGVGHALNIFAAQQANLLERCLLLYQDPEQGNTVQVKDIAPLFAQHWPAARPIGTLPRAPRLISLAKEAEQYVSPLDIAPHSAYTQAVHQAVEHLAQLTGLRLPQPMPRSSALQRLGAWWRALRNDLPLPPPASDPASAAFVTIDEVRA